MSSWAAWGEFFLSIAQLAKRIVAYISAQKRQKEADELANNPSGWFTGHFSNSLPVRSEQKLSQTDKADTDDH
ncbi:MAG: hypothetical protein WCS15_00240 [Prevotella sp.]|nr:hypothetical protein [Massilibacteroides sp.]